MQIKLYIEAGAQFSFIKNKQKKNSGGFMQTVYMWQWLVTCSSQMGLNFELGQT